MIYLGNNKIGSIYSGENKIDKIYKGEELVYSSYWIPFTSYVLATDSDFSGTEDGKFKYIGNDEYVLIPKVIKGKVITRTGRYWNDGGYYFPDYKTIGMFEHNSIIKGVATQEGHSIINMEHMFRYCKSTELNLQYLDTSNVTNMSKIFEYSKTTTVYCRTQADLDKFKSASNTPSTIKFII